MRGPGREAWRTRQGGLEAGPAGYSREMWDSDLGDCTMGLLLVLTCPTYSAELLRGSPSPRGLPVTAVLRLTSDVYVLCTSLLATSLCAPASMKVTVFGSYPCWYTPFSFFHVIGGCWLDTPEICKLPQSKVITESYVICPWCVICEQMK